MPGGGAGAHWADTPNLDDLAARPEHAEELARHRALPVAALAEREEGQPVREHLDAAPRELTLTIEEQAGGTLHVTGDGVDGGDVDLVLAPDPSGSTLYERGFSWSIRPDDPFNR